MCYLSLAEKPAKQGPRYDTHCRRIAQFYQHTHAFIREPLGGHVVREGIPFLDRIQCMRFGLCDADVSVCLSITRLRCAKTAKRIKVLFGVKTFGGRPTHCIRGRLDPPQRGDWGNFAYCTRGRIRPYSNFLATRPSAIGEIKPLKPPRKRGIHPYVVNDVTHFNSRQSAARGHGYHVICWRKVKGHFHAISHQSMVGLYHPQAVTATIHRRRHHNHHHISLCLGYCSVAR